MRLTPYPFAALARRMFRELEECGSIFDLPQGRFFSPAQNQDFSVSFHRHRVPSPLGPAAGPHTQMAQNLVLAWLGGARILELKTVQILDDLEIPRPCIDMRTVGYNAEWSQELTLKESLDEYVKGSMLIEMLAVSGQIPGVRDSREVIFDLSVGYDLAGIRSARVRAFIEGMMRAKGIVERLRGEIPTELGKLRDADFPATLADTVTLSTFHGCPPEEIESIILFLMEEYRLNCVVKFNPMLLGGEKTTELLHDRLGYQGIRVPASAFERDTTWEQAVAMMERLEERAQALGLSLGAKFTNTLIVENDQGFLPESEREVYLSGPPLHVLAMHLVRRFRRHFRDRIPVSFSAGIDSVNFPDAVALGLVPVTVCTDLLKKGGYGRMQAYHAQLSRRMEEVGARTVDDYILRAHGLAEDALEEVEGPPEDPLRKACLDALRDGGDLRKTAGDDLFAEWVSTAKLLNTERYVEAVARNPRYGQKHNATPPRKIGRHLQLFDCITCDLCVPVCPNDANFTYRLEEEEIPVIKARREAEGWDWTQTGTLRFEERHQIGTFADFCNECGNCDVFCPEDGGPYVVKPRFFRRAEDWTRSSELDGFQMERQAGRDQVRGRFEGQEFELQVEAGNIAFTGPAFRVRFDRQDPEGTLEGTADGEVDLTYFFIMDALRRAILDGDRVNYINSLDGQN